MIFPLRDVIPSRTTPWVTLSLIAVNVAVFLWSVTLGEDAYRSAARDGAALSIEEALAQAERVLGALNAGRCVSIGLS